MWAQASSPDWTDLAQFGAVGLFLMLFIAGVVVRGKQLEKAEERAERAEARERELRDRLDEKIIPLLTDLARLMTEMLDERRRR